MHTILFNAIFFRRPTGMKTMRKSLAKWFYFWVFCHFQLKYLQFLCAGTICTFVAIINFVAIDRIEGDPNMWCKTKETKYIAEMFGEQQTSIYMQHVYYQPLNTLPYMKAFDVRVAMLTQKYSTNERLKWWTSVRKKWVARSKRSRECFHQTDNSRNFIYGENSNFGIHTHCS